MNLKKNHWNEEYLKRRGLKFWWKYLPYNLDLKERAKELRKNMTRAERKLWVSFLQKYNKRWPDKITILRQKVIDNYIVDFYIWKFKLIIEIDGGVHENRQEYDSIRTQILEWFWLTEIRFSNEEIMNNFDDICRKIKSYFNKK